jgi:hypothetical protein
MSAENKAAHEGKWIRFVEDTPKARTLTWRVVANDGNVLLGMIGWFGSWRGYAFFPLPDRVFERTCLRDIADFIEQRNVEHREGLRAKRERAKGW